MRNTTKSYLDFRELDKNLAIFVRHVTKKPIWYMRARVGNRYITESLGTVDDAEATTEARQRFYKLKERDKQNIPLKDITFAPLHYLALIEQKTNALDQASPLVDWELPGVFATLRRLLEARMGKKGKREFEPPRVYRRVKLSKDEPYDTEETHTDLHG